jgi:hypothetical protein
MTDDDKPQKTTANLRDTIQAQYDKINDDLIAKSELSITSKEEKHRSLAASSLMQSGMPSTKDKDAKKSE